ncbi:MAG: DUF1810 domain-containing protein [Gammaproteobacteria bacterium]|nr:DUF1810 domain-containing protein [Gammaproteobacteria bacterium]MDH4253127.1 DUF1810 domain-containing protein [Gammaproteobacteria bacterium]MDH5308954.1 DUF1810 domain-containing protein [Gammaproteobacteria bacterium]
MNDPYDLARFLDAQERVYPAVVAELGRGRKTGHWIWYIFPQIAGLGSSAMSRRYSIGCVDEARAYLAHPVLGRRLRECVGQVMNISDKTAEQVFGSLDAIKFRSCLTLFGAAGVDPLFEQALDRYYGGSPDEATLRLLARA